MAPLFGHHRGASPVDLAQPARAASIISRLASAFPIIYEIELSPFIAGRGTSACGAVDVRVILRSGARRTP
jgi:hypothetical protein